MTTIEIIENFRRALAKGTLRDIPGQKCNSVFLKFCIRRHTGVVGHFITMVGTFSDKRRRRLTLTLPDLITSSTGSKDRAQCSQSDRERGGVSMTSRPNESVIDEIVASCNGDLRGALKALLMVNEHLEAEIAQLYAAAAHYGFAERGGNVLH